MDLAMQALHHVGSLWEDVGALRRWRIWRAASPPKPQAKKHNN
jgi:hypothetical protein